MSERDFAGTIQAICGKDERYDAEAYYFVREALDFTSRQLHKPAQGPNRHISGQELLEGIRKYAIKEYGPMALTVLTTWGVSCTLDFGEIVFNLVDAGVLGRTDTDSKNDFADGYDFGKAFREPFQPAVPLKKATRRKPGSRTRRPPEE